MIALPAMAIATIVCWYFWSPGPQSVDGGAYVLDRLLSDHAAPVWTVTFSPHGNLLASASVDAHVKVRKVDGTIVFDLAHPGGATAAAFSPDGKWLASAGYDGLVRVWGLDDGALARMIPASSSTVWALDFSPDGTRIASGGEDALIKLWNVADGSLALSLSGHTLNVWSVKFSPDGATLASGSFDATVRLWDMPGGGLRKTISGHVWGVTTVAFSPDGAEIVSGSDDGTARIWRAADGMPVRTFDGGYHVYAAAFSPDGKWLLTGNKDRPALGELLQSIFGASETNKWVTARLWETSSGKLLQTFSAHANDVSVNGAAFSQDGAWIASGSEDGTIAVWRRSSPTD